MASEATSGKARREWIWYPLLFAAFPVLTLFNGNLTEVAPGEVIRPLLVMLIAAAALWGLLALLLRNARKAALCCTFTLLLFFLYGIIRGLLLGSASPAMADFGREHAFLLRPWLVVLLLGFVLILRTRRDLRAWTGPLNAAGAFLVLWPLFGIGRTLVPRLFQPAPAPPVPAAAAPATAGKGTIPAEELPNIYYIILDGYAREDTLKRVFNYNNRPFLSRLERQGFYVAAESRANYSTTHMALPSALNMAYLDTLISPQKTESKKFEQLLAVFNDNAVTRELRGQGYRIVALTSETNLTLRSADRVIPFPKAETAGATDFELMLLSLTPLEPLSGLKQDKETNPYELHRRRIVFQLEQLPRAAGGSGPTFVFAHILCPHAPFVLQHKIGEYPRRTYDIRDGSYFITNGGTREEYLAEYPAQVECLNAMLAKTVDRLLKKSRRPTVIILQGDHGSGAYTDWEQPARTDFEERLSILCAIHTPGGPLPGLYPGITPVNIFRTLFNHYLKTDYPLLPDKSYFTFPGKPVELHDP